MGKDRLEWVDAGRGIAILLVVAYHAARWLPMAGIPTAGWQEINASVATLRMPLFFCLSGMFARKWQEAGWADLFRGKLALLLWVFFVWQGLGEVVNFIGLTVLSGRPSVKLAVLDLVLSPVFPRLELWFLWALAIFFVLARATRQVPAWVRLAVTSVASAVALTLWHYTTGWNGLLKYSFFFLVGLHLRSLLVRLSGAHRLLRLGCLLGWAGAVLLLSSSPISTWPGAYFVVACLGVLGGVSLATFLARVRGLVWIGRNTLPIYVAHTPAIIVCACALSIASVPGTAALQVAAPPVVAAIAVAAALALHAAAVRTGPGNALYDLPPASIRWLRVTAR